MLSFFRITYVSGSPSPPTHHSGCCTHFPRGPLDLTAPGQAEPARGKIFDQKCFHAAFAAPPLCGARAAHIFIYTSGSPSPPTHHSGCCTHFPRGPLDLTAPGQAEPARGKIFDQKCFHAAFAAPPLCGARAAHIFIYTSGSPSPPIHHSGCCTHFPRGP